MNLLKLIILNVLADCYLGHKNSFSTHSNACFQDFFLLLIQIGHNFLVPEKKN